MAGRYKAIRRELKLYSRKLQEKPELVVLNKIDALTPEDTAEKVKALQKACRRKPMIMSAVSHEGTKDVLRKLLPYVQETRRVRNTPESAEIFDDNDD